MPQFQVGPLTVLLFLSTINMVNFIDRGIVRRRKVDVAADIPARRIADLPVELDDKAGRSIRAAERELAAAQLRALGRTVF